MNGDFLPRESETALDDVRKIREQFARDSGGDLRLHVQQTMAATKGLSEKLGILPANKRRGSRGKYERALAQALFCLSWKWTTRWLG